MKIKTLISSIFLVAVVFIFNISTVNASNEQVGGITIPDKILIEATEYEAIAGNFEIVEDTIKETFKDLQGYTIDVEMKLPYYSDYDDSLYSAIVTFKEDTTLKISNANITLEYTNTKSKNSNDESSIKNLTIEEENYIISHLLNSDSYIYHKDIFKIIEEYYIKQINNSELKILVSSGSGAKDAKLNYVCNSVIVSIFKNDILYDVRDMGNNYSIYKVVIPIPSTEDEKIDYIKNEIIKHYNEKYQGIGYTKEDLDILKGGYILEWNSDKDSLEEITYNIEDAYTVYLKDIGLLGSIKDGENGNLGVIVVEYEDNKLNIENKDTNIKLEADLNVISKDTELNTNIVNEKIVLEVVQETLKNVSNKYIAYDITLTSNGVKIQPNGKVEISIPIPAGYDSNNLSIYRIEDNGNKVKYDVKIEGNYAIIETDHFSTYVIAENNLINNMSNNNELDETPKTGGDVITSNILLICITIIISTIVFKVIKK